VSEGNPRKQPGTLWRVSIEVTQRGLEAFESALSAYCASVTASADADAALWRIEGYAPAAFDRMGVVAILDRAASAVGIQAPAPRFDRVVPRDWLAENLASFRPVRAGRFFIRGNGYQGPIPAGGLRLVVDAGQAFGSGEHPTTAGCLHAIDVLARRRRFTRPLDVGCGSGILSLAMASAWRVRVLACDVDARAVRVARGNARDNGLATLVRVVHGEGLSAPAVRGAAPFDLIMANILARPLRRMAPAIADALRRGGVACLAGFLDRDAAGVIAACRARGLALAGRSSLAGWQTLVFERP
jgi:ribosomal protein L11 methyltransferase